MFFKTYSYATKHLGCYVFRRRLSVNVAVSGSSNPTTGFYTTNTPPESPNCISLDICIRQLASNYIGKKPIHTFINQVLESKSVQVGSNINDQLRIDDKKIDDETGKGEKRASGRSKLRSIIELMRWHKPTGTILALTPALWSVGLMTPETCSSPDLTLMAIFTAGAVAARGMGCTINDILDRKYDRLVERTKMRPIACGDISTKEALLYLAIQSTIGLYILCLNNLAVIKLGLFSGLMISTYPLFKRFTNWPQVMLALTMNWGVIMGYAAVKGSICMIDLTTLMPIYMGSILWTLFYDTIYAHQDKTDDMFIGVKSSALALGANTKRFLNQVTGGMFLSLALAGTLTGQLWPYYLSLALAGTFQTIQIRILDLDNKAHCWTVFDQQKYIGTLILGGILVSVALRSKNYRRDRQRNSERLGYNPTD